MTSCFVIWRGSDISQCEPEDRAWIDECLGDLELASLDELNGRSPTDSKHYCNLLSSFLNVYDFGALVSIVMPTSAAPPHTLDDGIDSLNLSERASNCLASAGVRTVGELVRWREEDLFAIRNMGRKTVAEILGRLLNLRIGPDHEVEPTRSGLQFSAGLLLGVEYLGISGASADALRSCGVGQVFELVSLDARNLRKIARLSFAEIQKLESSLSSLNVSLGVPAPNWVALHSAELWSCFGNVIRQHLLLEPLIIPPAPMSIEEEVQLLLVDSLDVRKAAMVQHFYGWDGGVGATLEAVGQHFGVSRERVRQILAGAIRQPVSEEFDMLDAALKYVNWICPAHADFVESELKAARLVTNNLRLESIAKAAEFLGKKCTWRVEEWANFRIVVNDQSAASLREFHSEMGRRVSRHGVTRLAWVFDGLAESIRAVDRDLACRTIEGLRWLDKDRHWFWIPTGRNAVFARLAKILKIAPEIDVQQALQGVLRDRRMEETELPLNVFRELCNVIPWCRLEGDRLLAQGSIPAGNEDSIECMLAEILQEHGPVLHRSTCWELARERGIEEVRFNQLLSNSNVITRCRPGFYALIGSTPIDEELPDLEDNLGAETQPFIDPSPIGHPTLPSQLDPHGPHFIEELYGLCVRRKRTFGDKAWSMAELALTTEERKAISEWGRVGTVSDLANSVRQREKAAVALLAFSAELTRIGGAEGELWPPVHDALNETLRSRLFIQPGSPKSFMREATETACRSLGIRHAFGREGEQAWVRTVFLQFGFSRQGWERLPYWLDNPSAVPVAVEDLLSRFDSSSFRELWTTLQELRQDSLTVAEAMKKLRGNPWVRSDELEDLVSAAIKDPDARRGPRQDTQDAGPGALFGEPRLLCHEEPWRFELRLANTQFLTEERYTLRIGKRQFPIIRSNGGYSAERDILIDLEELTAAAITVDLRHKGSPCLPEPMRVRLLPEGCRFAFYGRSSGKPVTLEQVQQSPATAYALLHSDDFDISASGLRMQRFGAGEWTIRLFEDGIPEGLRIFQGDHTEWEWDGVEGFDGAEMTVLKPQARCDGGWWGERVTVVVEETTDGELRALFVNEQRVSLRMVTQGKYHGQLELTPGLERDMSIRVEVVWKGRLRWLRANLQIYRLHGFAIQTASGWMALSRDKDIDVAYLKANPLKVSLPERVGDEAFGLESWAWMAGSHFWGRPRRFECAAGGHGIGEPLQVSLGPYNRQQPKYLAARAILDSGVIARVEQVGSEWELLFRNAIDLTDDHELWVWQAGSPCPEVIPRTNWQQEDGPCRLNIPGSSPLGFAVSFKGQRQGSRTGSGGFWAFGQHLSSIEDWKQTAAWLRWWRAPLLHPELSPAIQCRVESNPDDLLESWLGEPQLLGVKLLEQREDSAWLALTREFFWNWRPKSFVARQVLERFDVIDLKSSGLMALAERIIEVSPVILIRLLLALSAPSELRNSEVLKRLRNRYIELSPSASPHELRAQREALLNRAAEALIVNETLLSKRLLQTAVQMAQTQQVSIEQREDWNLRVAINNQHIVRQYLAVELLQKLIDGTLQ